MPRFVRHLYTLCFITLLVSACSPKPEELATDKGFFGFSVDPISQTVTLNEASAASLSPEQTSDEPRVLTSLELRSRNFDYAFLPGNMLRIEVEFTNVIDERFGLGIKQPFTFSPVLSGTSGRTVNIVSSEEPIVTDDADLGGDGVLSFRMRQQASFLNLKSSIQPRDRLAYFVEC